jgi:hypothetical protein
MNGQWIGRYTGSNTGLLVVEIDDMGTHYEGRAFAYDDNPLLPGTVVLIKTPDKAKHYQQNLELFPINPRTGDPGTWDQIAQHFPAGTAFPRRADVTLNRTGKNLKVSWTTDMGTSGAVDIPKTRAAEPTEYQPLPDVTDWKQFKQHVNSLEHRRYIFRGQRQPLRLRTAYHRTERADLTRFLQPPSASWLSHTAARLDLFSVCRRLLCLSSPA